jgi:hypothetical protein
VFRSRSGAGFVIG